MNVQSSKKILFNKSSLLSLKAELMKKQEEVHEKKQLYENRIENHKPPSSKASVSEKTENKEKKTFKDGLKAVDTEELEACRKSKLALEKKAELYEHLADSAGNSELAGRFLVDFNTKKHEEVKDSVRHTPDVDESEDIRASGDNDIDADEWIEFTDCLGRTRKCHKSDLDMFKQKDKSLARSMFSDSSRDERSADPQPPESQEPVKEKPLLVQTTNDYLQSLRDKWEDKERELLAKDKDIHYQDLLFDEARIHGVGYYAFSTDETERQKQMEDLIKERKATLDAQKQAEEQRKKRDEIMAARVKAARARQRMRAGLPPEEPEDTTKDFTAHLLEFLTQQRDEADTKAKEEDKKKKEELEKERQKLREDYIREWDLGKTGVHEKIKKFRQMTQEEYVDQQRDKRIDEFAPPKASSSKIEHRKSNNAFDDRGKVVDTAAAKSWSDVRPKAPTPPPPDIGELTEQKGLYFSSKKQNVDEARSSVAGTEVRPTLISIRKEVRYKNFVKSQEPEPIVNELSDDESAEERSATDKWLNQPSGAEVAPPPTYDYYGPVPKKQRFAKPFESDIREAYAQGAKSLETKPQCRQISKDYDFMFE